MKKPPIALLLLIILVCISTLQGCAGNNAATDNSPATHYEAPKSVEQFGHIPDMFQNIVENNLFHGITAFNDRLLKAETICADGENNAVTHTVRMMDIYGNDLAEYTCSSNDAYHAATLTATADGGFLFVLGFVDHAYDQNTWASDNGFASRVIKCDKEGDLQFDTPFDNVEGSALEYCFEKDGRFYLFGTTQTPETKTQGTYSPTDVNMVILEKNGAVLKRQCIAGSNFDSLDAAEVSGDRFVLSIRSQSDDGDFAGSNSNGYPVDWTVTVNDDLEITEKERASSADPFDYRIGEKDEVPVYKSNDLLDGFDAGTPTAFIDYGDFYLIVSENTTGIYENTPLAISSVWYYTETVYSSYDQNGQLIFRTSVDSSPDFDAMVESLADQ